MNNILALTNIMDYVTSHARVRPDHTVILSPGSRNLTYCELEYHASKLSRDLIRLGCSLPRRVGVVLPNGLEMLLAFFGITAISTFVPLNPAFTLEEFRVALKVTRIDVLLTEDEFSSAAIQAANEASIPVLMLTAMASSGWEINTAVPLHPANANTVREHPAVVLQTTGTTSIPKVVPLTHHNLCTVAEHNVRFLGMTERDRCINVIPLFHIYGILTPVLTSVVAGGSIVCMEKFDPETFFRLLDECSPNWYAAGPTIHQELARFTETLKETSPRHFLSRIQSGGARISPKLLDRLESFFRTTVIQGYGLTETTGMGTLNPLNANKTRQGSAGIPVGSELRIVDDRGQALHHGQEGQILVRGPGLMSGYENIEETDQKAFLSGWFVTGDLGYLDSEGYLFITGRIREIINRGGQKVLPREVEEALLAHPGVAEAVVFPMPHPSLGEAVAAVFIAATGNVPSEFELRLYLSDRLTAYKIPARVLRVESIPKGPTGKVKRSDLFGHFQDQLTTHAATTLHLSGNLDPDTEAVRTEQLLKGHPEILDCAVIPMPTRHGGVNLIAFIVNRGQFTWHSFLDLLLQSGTSCIAPANFVGLKALPMNPDQLVNRQALAEFALKLDINPLPSEIPEIMLAAICRSVLGVERIKMQDDLFTLGVDSLKIMDLLVTIERELGRAVSPETLFSQPTLEGLLQALQKDSSQAAESALIEIQRGSSKAPFFFINGDYNGGGFHCRRLARLLGSDAGLVTFIPHGQPGQKIPTSIEAMAEQYLPLLRNYQPVGPYRLGGHCNGALVALELAHRLLAAGQPIDRLVLISPPPIDTVPVTTESLSTVSESMLECTLRYQPTAVRRGILNVLYRRAIRRYMPKQFDGNTSLLMTAVDSGNAPDPSRGWLKLLPQAKIQRIPGEHLSIFTKNLPVLARALRHCLDGS